MKFVLRALPVLVALMIGYAPANAALLFEDYKPNLAETALASSSAGPIFGTEFTLGNQDLRVTKLGTFAFASDLTVGIWDVVSQTLMGSAPVATSLATPSQGWQFVGVAPFTLLKGATYRIAAQTQANTLAWGGTYDAPAFGINVTPGHVWAPQPGFTYPFTSANGMAMAANAEIAPIPEPSSVALLLAGLAGLWFARRRAA
jgi:hypothetical protein